MQIEVTMRFIRKDVNTPWPTGIEKKYQDYINEKYIYTGRMLPFTMEVSEDRLTKIVKRKFADNESFMLFRTDPKLYEIKSERKKYMLENDILLFDSVDYLED